MGKLGTFFKIPLDPSWLRPQWKHMIYLILSMQLSAPIRVCRGGDDSVYESNSTGIDTKHRCDVVHSRMTEDLFQRVATCLWWTESFATFTQHDLRKCSCWSKSSLRVARSQHHVRYLDIYSPPQGWCFLLKSTFQNVLVPNKTYLRPT